MDTKTVATFISLEVASGFLKEHGKEIYSKVRALLTPDELISLDLFEKHPENNHLRNEIVVTLDKHLTEDLDSARELVALLWEKMPAFRGTNNTIMQTGSNNIAAQGLHKSNVNIHKP